MSPETSTELLGPILGSLFMNSFLKLIQDPLNDISSFCYINCLAEHACNPTVYASDKDVEEHLPQDGLLHDTICHQTPPGDKSSNQNPLSMTIQSIPYPSNCLLLKSISFQFRDKSVILIHLTTALTTLSYWRKPSVGPQSWRDLCISPRGRKLREIKLTSLEKRRFRGNFLMPVNTSKETKVRQWEQAKTESVSSEHKGTIFQ